MTRTMVRCCYAVVSLVLLVSTLTSAERDEERSRSVAATTRTTEQRPTSVGLSLTGGYEIAALHGASIMRGLQQQQVEIDGTLRPAMEAFDYLAGVSGYVIRVVYRTTTDGVLVLYCIIIFEFTFFLLLLHTLNLKSFTSNRILH